MLYFSIKGVTAQPITISRTPSDRNAGKKIAADICRELKRLGVHPMGEVKWAWGAVHAFVGTRLIGRAHVISRTTTLVRGLVKTHTSEQSLWTMLRQLEAGAQLSIDFQYGCTSH